MGRSTEGNGNQKEGDTAAMRIIERVEGHYETQDVEFGRVYRWQPKRVTVECKCGKRTTFKGSTLTGSATTCECGQDHADSLQEEMVAHQMLKDEDIHPWRYWQPPKGTGLPF